jgi:hypothetical protein
MYVGKYDHGSLHIWSGSRVRADICYAQVQQELLDYGAVPTLVLRSYSEFTCIDNACKYSPCYAVSMQGDRPAIPPQYTRP